MRLGLGLSLRNRSGGIRTSYDPDALAYFDREEMAGTPLTDDQKVFFNGLFLAFKAEGQWDELDEIGILYGTTDLTSARQKLKVFPATSSELLNTGHVGGDYTASGASKGISSGTGKYLDTGIPIQLLDPTDFSFLARYETVGAGVNVGIIGSSYAATGNGDRFYIFRNAANGNEWGLGDRSGTIAPDNSGTVSIKASLNLAQSFKDGVLDDSLVWNNLGQQIGTIRIGENAGVASSGGVKLKAYVVGRSFDQLVVHQILSNFESNFP